MGIEEAKERLNSVKFFKRYEEYKRTHSDHESLLLALGQEFEEGAELTNKTLKEGLDNINESIQEGFELLAKSFSQSFPKAKKEKKEDK